jgi:hypothetical protein
MDYIVLDGVKPYDGRYELDLEQQPFTTREWGWIKRHANYLPLTVWDGFQGGDPELFAVFAVISLRRAGRIDTTEAQGMFDRLQDMPLGAVRYEAGSNPQEPADDPTGSSNGNNGSSGAASRTSSEQSATTPPASGIPVSATSASDPVTWAN